MLLKVKGYNIIPAHKLDSWIKLRARLKAQTYPFGIVEQNLDWFLKNNWKLSLKKACFIIINNCKIMQESGNSEITITLLDPELDKIASVITYGFDGKCGSPILKQIFRI